MRTLLALLFVTLFATHAAAQGLAYAEGGVAGLAGFAASGSHSFHIAGGGEAVAADRIGLGGEIGFFGRLITVSGNATFHLTPLSSQKAGAFVTGGYTRFGVGDGEGGFNAWNVGAGAHLWFSDHAGLRLEFRDHIRPDSRGTRQYWSARAGVVVR
jgi:hypothetical protein